MLTRDDVIRICKNVIKESLVVKVDSYRAHEAVIVDIILDGEVIKSTYCPVEANQK